MMPSASVSVRSISARSSPTVPNSQAASIGERLVCAFHRRRRVRPVLASRPRPRLLASPISENSLANMLKHDERRGSPSAARKSSRHLAACARAARRRSAADLALSHRWSRRRRRRSAAVGSGGGSPTAAYGASLSSSAGPPCRVVRRVASSSMRARRPALLLGDRSLPGRESLEVLANGSRTLVARRPASDPAAARRWLRGPSGHRRSVAGAGGATG